MSTEKDDTTNNTNLGDPTGAAPDPADPSSDDSSSVETAPSDPTSELERLRAALNKANKESAARRKKIEALEKAEADREKEKLSELDRLKLELDEMKKQTLQTEASAKESLVRAAFVAAAAKVGASHPDDVYFLADKSEIEVDLDTGTVTGVDEAVASLVEDNRLVMTETKRSAPDTDAGAGKSSGANKGLAALTPAEAEMARRMKVPLERAAAQKAAMASEGRATSSFPASVVEMTTGTANKQANTN